MKRAAEYRAIQFAPIAVSGLVLDQFDQPLRNVPIEFVVDQSGFSASATKKGITTTDVNGAFQISGYEGTAIAIVPKLDGLILIPTNNRVIYSSFHRQDPVESVTVEQTAGDRMWATQVGLGAFMTSRHGNVHSKVGIGFHINEEPADVCWIRIHSLCNPNGSRNWEEDPKKVKTIE